MRRKLHALTAAYQQHPERIVHGAPRAKAPPEKVSINPLPTSIVTLPSELGSNEIASMSEPATQENE